MGYSPWGRKESDTANNKCLGRGPQGWAGRASGALGGTAALGSHCGDVETDRLGSVAPPSTLSCGSPAPPFCLLPLGVPSSLLGTLSAAAPAPLQWK